MFAILPTLEEHKFTVISFHPWANHLPKVAILQYVPYRRWLAARAKLALKQCSSYHCNASEITSGLYGGLLDAIEHAETCSVGRRAGSSCSLSS